MPDSDSEFEEAVVVTTRRSSTRKTKKKKVFGDSSDEDKVVPTSRRATRASAAGTRIQLRLQKKRFADDDDYSGDSGSDEEDSDAEEYKPDNGADDFQDSDAEVDEEVEEKKPKKKRISLTKRSSVTKKPRLSMKLKLKQKCSNFFENDDNSSAPKKDPPKPLKCLQPPPEGICPIIQVASDSALTRILSFLDVPDLGRVAQTCSKLTKASKEDAVWSKKLNILLDGVYGAAFKGDKNPIAKRHNWDNSTTFLEWLKDNSSAGANQRKDVVRYMEAIEPLVDGYADSNDKSDPACKWLVEPTGLREYYYRAGKLAVDSVQEYYTVYKNTGYCRFCEERNGLNGKFCGLCNKKQDDDTFKSNNKLPKIALFSISRDN